jgi:hypothetical protein
MKTVLTIRYMIYSKTFLFKPLNKE